ncbi:MAG: hypothetical protein ACPG52_09310 [Cognaticolwellia sp.]
MYKIYLLGLLLLMSQYANSQQVDPTKPFGAVASAKRSGKSATLVLQSIIQREGKKKAIINGQALKVGDTYNGFELIKINSKAVVLKSAQGKMELSLFSGVIANSK